MMNQQHAGSQAAVAAPPFSDELCMTGFYTDKTPLTTRWRAGSIPEDESPFSTSIIRIQLLIPQKYPEDREIIWMNVQM